MKEVRNVPFGNLDTKDPSEMELLEKKVNEKYKNSSDYYPDNEKVS